MLASILPAFVVAVASLASSGARAQSCPTGYTTELCCRSVGPYKDNAYVWENICEIFVDDDTTVIASGCTVPSVCAT